MTLEELLVLAFEKELQVCVNLDDGELTECASVEEVMDLVNSCDEPHLYIDDEWMQVLPKNEHKIGDFDREGWLEEVLG